MISGLTNTFLNKNRLYILLLSGFTLILLFKGILPVDSTSKSNQFRSIEATTDILPISNPTFRFSTWNINLGDTGGYDMTTGDIDNDGKPELLVADLNSEELIILSSDNGSIQEENRYHYGSGNLINFKVGDWDASGFKEIIGNDFIIEFDGENFTHFPLSTTGLPVLNDANNDGIEDVLYWGGIWGNENYSLYQQGELIATYPSIVPFPPDGRIERKFCGVGDYNGDGWNEIAMYNFTIYPMIHEFYGISFCSFINGKLKEEYKYCPQNQPHVDPHTFSSLDINDDGIDDIMLTSETHRNILFGSGTSFSEYSFSTGYSGFTDTIFSHYSLIQRTPSGNPELLLAEGEQSRWLKQYQVLNTELLLIGEMNTGPTVYNSNIILAISSGDYDGDAYPEVAAILRNGTLLIRDSACLDISSPIITSPPDIAISFGDQGNIFWQPNDAYPSHYEIYQNSTLLRNSSWNNEDNIVVSLDNLSIGTHIFEVIVYDLAGHSISDSVQVEVIPFVPPVTTSSTEVTSVTSSLIFSSTSTTATSSKHSPSLAIDAPFPSWPILFTSIFSVFLWRIIKKPSA